MGRVVRWLLAATIPTAAFAVLWSMPPSGALTGAASVEDALLAAGRWLGLGIAAWLIVTQLLYTFAVLTHIDWMVEVLRPVTLPIVRRVAAGAASITITLSSVTAVAQSAPDPTVIVFEDADLERALDAVVFMIYSLNGERCTSSSRLLVQASIAEEFTGRLTERVGRLRLGHPLDPHTEVGPLIHQRHRDKVTSYFEIARDEGARIAAGGAAVEGPGGGHYVAPTLFTNAQPRMRIAQEEIFGPVLTAIPFADEQEAIAIANDVRYGLAAYLWTGDVGRALRVSERLEAGMIWVNSENVRHLPTPFGGAKASGIGRDGGDYSFDFYMETKNVALATGVHAIPRLGGG